VVVGRAHDESAPVYCSGFLCRITGRLPDGMVSVTLQIDGATGGEDIVRWRDPAVSGVQIRLTPERWQHTVCEHPELTGLGDKVLATAGNPSKVLAGGQGELPAVGAADSGKFMAVVCKETVS